MTEKRYSHDGIVIVDHLKENLIYIDGKDELLELAEYVDKLQEENEELKRILQDSGLLISEKEIIEIRSEIANKFIKPLYKTNGFDVDVDCTEGFTIIPKKEVIEND